MAYTPVGRRLGNPGIAPNVGRRQGRTYGNGWVRLGFLNRCRGAGRPGFVAKGKVPRYRDDQQCTGRDRRGRLRQENTIRPGRPGPSRASSLQAAGPVLVGAFLKTDQLAASHDGQQLSAGVASTATADRVPVEPELPRAPRASSLHGLGACGSAMREERTPRSSSFGQPGPQTPAWFGVHGRFHHRDGHAGSATDDFSHIACTLFGMRARFCMPCLLARSRLICIEHPPCPFA